MANIDVVVGAQFGSEAKGHVTAQLIQRYQKIGQRILNIRVAGPNAGHTVVDQAGNRIALRTIPVGAALNNNNPPAQCYLAPGSEIQMSVLEDEIRHLNSLGHYPTVYVSDEATLLTDQHIETERSASMHERLGSTAKGIGAARADRIMRTALRIQDDPNAMARLRLLPGVITVHNHLLLIDKWLRDAKAAVVIEGTQGYGLGLHAGHYPKCTSSDTRAIDFLAMAGVNPWWGHHLNVWAVARVYPIRVAGDSGEMVGETTWEALGLDEEHTTVTKKVRRVGAWDPNLVRNAVAANGGAGTVKIALTMADQKIPEVAGWSGIVHDYTETRPDAVRALQNLVRDVEDDAQADVFMVTTSDRTAVWL